MTEELLDILYSGTDSSNVWREDASVQGYVNELTKLSLERIVQEPDLLRQQGESVCQEMEALAFSNYKTFVASWNFIKESHEQVSRSSVLLQDVAQLVGSATGACEKFASAGKDIVEKKASVKNCLQHHATLVELLEIPQLMNTCVRNGYYEDALQLDWFCKQLLKTHGKVPILMSLVDEVKASTMELVAQLQQKLRSNIQLPTCLRVIGFLRRVGIFSELELKIMFLKSRDVWLTSLHAAIPENTPYTYLTKYIELNRSHLFDISTQYRAIFSEEGNFDETGDGGVLHGWLTQKVTKFLQTLDKYLPIIKDGASLNNVLDQCMFFGMSLGRVGLDFRALLPPLFERHIFIFFSGVLRAICSAFLERLRSTQWNSTVLPTTQTTPVDASAAPMALLDFPLLAITTNQFLEAFNELRQCTPLCLQSRVSNVLEESLFAMTLAMKTYAATVTLTDAQREELASTCRAMAELFVPFIASAYSRLFHATRCLVDIPCVVEALAGLYQPRPVAAQVADVDTGALTDTPAIGGSSFSGVDSPSQDGDTSRHTHPVPSEEPAPPGQSQVPSQGDAAAGDK